MTSSLVSAYLCCFLILCHKFRSTSSYISRSKPLCQRVFSTKVAAVSEAEVDAGHGQTESWWGRGGLPQKVPSISLLPARPSYYSHYPIEQNVPPSTNPKKKPRRKAQVYKHLFRYFTNASVECWLATVTPEDLFLSCGYSRDEVTRMAEEFPPLLELDARGHLTPKLRFLVRCLGGGEGDICHGECLDDILPAGGEECDEFHPHDLVVSDLAKDVIPPDFFGGQNLEKTLAPRHAYLEFCHLPHGIDLLSGDGLLLRDFLEACGKPAAEFAALCNRWAHAKNCDPSMSLHDAERVNTFQLSFSRGLLAAARNDMSTELQLLGCTAGRMMELLVRHGASPIHHGRSGASLLHWAAGTGNMCGTKAILYAMDPRAVDEGNVADIIMTTRGGKDSATPLHWSSCGVDCTAFGCGGHLQVCRFFLEEAGHRCDELANAKTVTGNTPLMWACWSGSLEVAKLLVENGADPHGQNENGCSSAHWASSGGELLVCKYLHGTLGVDFKRAENKAGHTPLNHAISYGRIDVAEWIASECYDSKNDADMLLRELDLTKEFVGADAEKVREKLKAYINR